MKVIWLAAYPKSGVTWLQFLLANYICDNIQDSMSVLNRIPDIHRQQLNVDDPTLTGNVLCKTHFLFDDRHPHHEHTAGFIYLLRHPKDILLSNLNYFKLLSPDGFDKRHFVIDFINKMGFSEWLQRNFGSWNEHISTWMALANKKPHFYLRYEQLHTDPYGCMERIIDFLRMEKDQDRIYRSIEASSFDSMKQIERREKEKGCETLFPGKKKDMDAGTMFVNKGKTGQSLDSIGPDLDQLFDERFEHVLDMLNYNV